MTAVCAAGVPTYGKLCGKDVDARAASRQDGNCEPKQRKLMKRKLFQFLAVLGLCLSAQAGLNDGLVAYYPFNGNANDATGNGHNGQLYGSPSLTSDRFGIPNNTYNFSGNSCYISIPNDLALATPNLSFSMWIRVTSRSSDQYLLSDYGWSGSQNCGYHFRINTQGKLDLRLHSGPASVGVDAIGNSLIPLSQWVHVAGTYDGNAIRVYVNGLLDAPPTNYTGYCWSAYRNTVIGNASWTLSWGYNGCIDDVRRTCP